MNGRMRIMGNIPASPRAQLTALRMTFGDAYVFNVIVRGDKLRYEAVAKDGRSPYCLISTDASEIWHELKGAVSGDG